jgi:hypothetical protein
MHNRRELRADGMPVAVRQVVYVASAPALVSWQSCAVGMAFLAAMFDKCIWQCTAGWDFEAARPPNCTCCSTPLLLLA